MTLPRQDKQRTTARLKIILLITSQLIGAGLFARGFFPAHKPPSGYGAPPHPMGKAPFDRLVFVLIDALRSDFMFGTDSRMNFTQSLVRDGKALPYTAIAQAPTVTLPRLKAMTTGMNPQFLDAVLNIADSTDQGALLERSDSWLRQLLFSSQVASPTSPLVMQRKAIFYGDDTWLRLFPSSWFAEVDGVSSFYVTDTEIVDYNVTRHLDHALSEKQQQEWDIAILHYLGLDHVGHLGGSKSILMGPKQEQLDLAISRIFDGISKHDLRSKKKTLLLVAGDHGMTDAGNHGGSSKEELSTALLLASPSFNRVGSLSAQKDEPERVQQVDIVPTLAMLFGTGIPPASIGVAIESALELSFGDQKPHNVHLEAALRNHAVQLTTLLQQVFGGLSPVKAFLHLDDLGNANENLEAIISRLDVDRVRTILHRSQQYLLTRFSGYHLPSMVLGLIFLTIAVVGFIFEAFRGRGRRLNNREIMVVVLAAVQLASFGSTSFIEEEHEAWFFLGASSLSILAFLAPTTRKYHYLLGVVLIRVLRGWSHNGQKAGVDNSISNFVHGKPWLCHLLDPLGVYYLVSSQTRSGPGGGHYSSMGMLLIIGAGVFSLTPMDRPFLYLSRDIGVLQDRETRPRLLYGLLVSGLGLSFFRDMSKQSFRGALRIAILVLLRSLTKMENYPVLWLSFFAGDLCHFLTSNIKSPGSREGEVEQEGPILSTWIQLVFFKSTFFALGGSNSLATVDLSNAYNGLRSFSLPMVTLLTFLSNFSGSMIVGLGGLIQSSMRREESGREEVGCRQATTLVRSAYFSLHFLLISILSTHFSDHLFVFSVFSPAVLYAFVWLFGFHTLLSLLEILSSFL
ncbi:major facilitator super transporter protein [Puccinia graminis f. sp. tritici]|uniref:GPI ethanolamine phosphate transferase 2 n=1 Tax=Puccinia graminis f. sp. tritici TaxID=56615 RepID=A0A5B0NNC9_PUCGR|nr:major facilitator super transporter protein [Puccinia graminis f. sp. tritici]KAA1090821.1 major facilitator super transporter protein [Puccinia graminis f. sp. tritici]